ncbi:MAG: hypothetical protein MUC87_07565 [Bacteroidia bacterium]|jgi:hypothetical protein|nr:hypothetical protein [Bacteroidia bacterium]
MKNLFSLFLLLYCGNLSAQKQQDLQPLISYVDSLRVDNQRIINGNKQILSDPAWDLFMKRRIAYCLTADGNVSLFHNYVFADISDARFSFGRNIGYSAKNNKKLHSILSLGISADADDDKNFSAIYTNGKFNGSISADIKFTHFFGRSVYFGKTNKQKGIVKRSNFTGFLFSGVTKSGYQKSVMDSVRSQCYNTINKKLSEDTARFNKQVAGVPHNDSVYQRLLGKFIETKMEEYHDLRAETEADALEKGELYNANRACWWSLSAQIPITGSRFNVADTYSAYAFKRETWKWNISAQINILYERVKGQQYYFYLGGAIFNQNSAESGDLELLNIDKYKGNGGINTNVINSGQSLYVGNFNVFEDGNLYLKFVLLSPFRRIDWAGLSFFAEQRFRKNQQVTNLYLGIPLTLEGENDQRINLELQCIWGNVLNAMSAEKNAQDKFTLGFKVGIPFGQSTL